MGRRARGEKRKNWDDQGSSGWRRDAAIIADAVVAVGGRRSDDIVLRSLRCRCDETARVGSGCTIPQSVVFSSVEKSFRPTRTLSSGRERTRRSRTLSSPQSNSKKRSSPNSSDHRLATHLTGPAIMLYPTTLRYSPLINHQAEKVPAKSRGD